LYLRNRMQQRLPILFILFFVSFFLTSANPSFGQFAVSGQVLDETNTPIPGVNIQVQGTSRGTVSDQSGRFNIEVSNGNILVFSFVGYENTQVTVSASQTSLVVKLQPSTEGLEEVVVIGYGTATSKNLTGAISAVSGKNIADLKTARFDQALQGQVPGVQISTASGSPGGAVNIRIRGLTTNGDNNPLILVDGIPYSTEGLNAISPSDIESIHVLKDAAAAIYGVRAANGVILVTTKQGKASAATRVEYTGFIGMQSTSKKLDLLRGREYAILKNEAFAAGGQTPPFVNPDIGFGTDWQSEVFQQAPISSHNLTIGGGSEKTKFSIGGAYFDQLGIVGGDKSSYSRYNARVNFTTELAPKVTLQNVFLYTHENRSALPENGIASVLYNTINASPAATVKQADGTFTFLEEFSDIINPLAQISNSFNGAKVNKLVGKQEVAIELLKGLNLTGRVGYNYANVGSKVFNPLVYYGSGKAQNTVSNAELIPDSLRLATGFKVPLLNNVVETQQTYFNYNIEAFLNYERLINDMHQLRGTLGLTFIQDQGESLTGIAYNVPYNQNNFADISASEGNNLLNNSSSYQYRSRLQSFFWRGEYGFQDRYLASMVLRRDGSSNFGVNNRFGLFPSLSLGWIASSESFFKSQKIDFLKLRGSYGVVGNDKIGLFRYRALLGGEAVYSFNDQLINGIAIGAFGNQDLKWETTSQGNIGLDLKMFDNRVEVTADYYVKSTRDLLFAPDISAIVGAYSAGSSPPIVNGGNVRNSGLEFLLRYYNAPNRPVSYSLTYTLTTVKNKVTALQQGVDFFEFGSFGVGGGSATRMEVGYPIGYFFGYKTEGVFQTGEEIATRGVQQEGSQPGDLRYADIDGDGNINFSNNSDKTFLGSAIPDFIMGLQAAAGWKGFDLSLSLYASVGNEILRNYERQQPLANLLAYRIGRWTGEGSTNIHPRQTTAANKNGVLSDYFVEDGSFLRLRNVQLGYQLPERWLKPAHIQRLRVYGAANNLLTLTRYRGFDPDFNSGSSLTGGVDFGFYPQAKTIMFGFELTF